MKFKCNEVYTGGWFGYGSLSCSNSDTCVNELIQTLLRKDNFEIRKPMIGLSASVQNIGKKLPKDRNGENCLSWVHQNCSNVQENEDRIFATITATIATFCSSYCKLKNDRHSEEMNFFEICG